MEIVSIYSIYDKNGYIALYTENIEIATIYIENNGIRTVPDEYVEDVKVGKFVDPSVYYFRTVPTFETYDKKYKWMMNCIFICCATRLPENVLLKFYKIN